MEFGKKHTTTSEEFGQGLWMLCMKYSKGFYAQFRSQIEEVGFSLSKEQKIEFSREILMANLWIISKTLSSDKKAIDKLHEIFILGHRNIPGSEEEKREMVRSSPDDLNRRYMIYDDAWRDGAGDQTLLAIAMLEQMLNRGQPDQRLINALLAFSLNTHVLVMMQSVSEFREDFEVVD